MAKGILLGILIQSISAVGYLVIVSVFVFFGWLVYTWVRNGAGGALKRSVSGLPRTPLLVYYLCSSRGHRYRVCQTNSTQNPIQLGSGNGINR
jgi:hypothetical protein